MVGLMSPLQRQIDGFDIRAASFGKRVDEVEVEDVPNRGYPIPSADLFALFVRSSIVGNRDLVSSGSGFANHGGDLDLHSKTTAAQLHWEYHVAVKCLVACFDIRHVAIRQNIAEAG